MTDTIDELKDKAGIQEITFEKDGRQISLIFDDWVMIDHIQQHGDFNEHWMLNFIRDKVQRTGTWVDIGANAGNHAVFFDLFCTCSRVVAFEPVMYNYGFLLENLRRNGCSKTVPLAFGLGSHHEFRRYQLAKSQRWSQATLDESAQGTIPILKLDDFDYPEVSLVKLDVEGMEWDVLQGATDTIARYHPEFFIEIWRDDILQLIDAFMARFGYTRVFRYNHAPTYHYSTMIFNHI